MKTFTCLVGALTVVASCTNPTLTVTDLGTSSPEPSAALDISDNGRIVGVVGPNGEHAAEFHEDGSVIRLPKPPGYTHCRAVAVANDGVIAGSCRGPDENETLPLRAVYWDATRTVHVIASNPDVIAGAVDMNNHGVIVGTSYVNGEFTATSWLYDTRAGTLTVLPLLPPSSTMSIRTSASAINDAGEVVGTVSDGTFAGDRAVKWSAKSLTITQLATPTDCASQAWDIDNRGVIAGAVCYTYPHLGNATIWSSATTPPESLPGPPPDPSHLLMGATAQAMSDSGLVIGLSGRYSQRSLTEVPIGWTADRRLIDFGAVNPTAVNASGVIVGTRVGAGGGRAVRVTVQ